MYSQDKKIYTKEVYTEPTVFYIFINHMSIPTLFKTGGHVINSPLITVEWKINAIFLLIVVGMVKISSIEYINKDFIFENNHVEFVNDEWNFTNSICNNVVISTNKSLVISCSSFLVISEISLWLWWNGTIIL